MSPSSARLSRLVGPGKQRGAAALFAAIAVIAAVTGFSLVFDIGQLYYAQRDLQRLANIAALDSAMVVGGCRGGVSDDSLAEATSQAQISVSRNGGAAALAWLNAGFVQVGDRQSEAGIRSLRVDAASRQPGVRIRLQRPQPGLIMPLLRASSGNTLTATGVAIAGPHAVLEVGSFAARVSSGSDTALNAIYGGLLGNPIGLTLLSYEGLADAEVSLQDILDADPTVSELTEPFRQPDSLSDFLQTLADATLATGQAVAGNALRQLAAAADPGLVLLPADVINLVGDPGERSDQLFVSVGEVATAAIQAAHNALPVDLGLVVDIPGVVRLETSVQVIDGGQVSIGSDAVDDAGLPLTRAGSAQLGMSSTIEVLGPAGPLLSFELTTGAIEAEAEVVDIRCAGPGQAFHMVLVDATSSAAAVEVRNITLHTGLPLLGALALGDLNVRAANRADTPMQFGSATRPEYPQTQQAPAVSDGLSAALTNAVADAVVARLGGVVGPLLPPVQGLLDAVVDDALGQLTGPVDAQLSTAFRALGVQAAGADITVRSVTAVRPFVFTQD